MNNSTKSWLSRIAVFAGYISFSWHGNLLHPLMLISTAALVLTIFVALRQKKSYIRLLLPFSAGLLCFLMKQFYWDKFDFTSRVNSLLLLSLIFTILLTVREFKLLKKFLLFFNGLKLKKRLLAMFIFLETFFILSSGMMVKKGVKLGGDEPHYLAISHSIIKDFDLNVFNQYFRKGYREFSDVERLPAHGAFGKGYKKLYSTHLPGVSVTVAPFMWLKLPLPWLYFLVRAYLGLFGALLGVVVYLFSFKLWKNENLSLFVTTVFMLTAPVFFHSFHLFPELQALLLVLSSLYFLLFPGKRVLLKTLLSGFLLGAVIFWGLKYMIFIYLLSLGFFVYFMVKREYKRALLFILFPILFQLLFFYYLYFAYGNLSPMSIYTGMMSDSQAEQYYSQAGTIPLQNRLETLLGYFFDQRDGLLLYSPFYFFAFPGLLLALRKFKTYWPHLLISVPGFFYILYHGYSTVRAGYCPQARYLVPVIWVMLLFAVIFHLESPNNLFKKIFYLLPIYSGFVVVYQVLHPFTLYQPATHDNVLRSALMFSQWGNLYFDPAHFLPSFIKVAGNFKYVPNLVFLVLLVVLIAWALRRTKPSPTAGDISFCVSRKYAGPILFAALFVFFLLFPRQALYNPTLVQKKGDMPYTIYRESRQPRRAPQKIIKIEAAGRQAFTVSTLKGAEHFVLEFENRGDTEVWVEIYNYDNRLGRTLVQARQTSRISLKNPGSRRLKNRFFYQFTLILESQEAKPFSLGFQLYPTKAPAADSR